MVPHTSFARRRGRMAEIQQPSVITSSIDEFGHTQVCEFNDLVGLTKQTHHPCDGLHGPDMESRRIEMMWALMSMVCPRKQTRRSSRKAVGSPATLDHISGAGMQSSSSDNHHGRKWKRCSLTLIDPARCLHVNGSYFTKLI